MWSGSMRVRFEKVAGEERVLYAFERAEASFIGTIILNLS
jgi:hypothetical protein